MPKQLNESFIIELQSNTFSNKQSYFKDNSAAAYSINSATKFQSFNTALQFNRIINGRIVSVFN